MMTIDYNFIWVKKSNCYKSWIDSIQLKQKILFYLFFF